jgi:hypothetical protein
MDFLELDRRVTNLVEAKQFDMAEAELHQAGLQASQEKGHYNLECVLSSLVELYCIMQPPDFAKAESYCVKREQLIGTAIAKMQFAMTLYWSMRDPARTVTKARERR